MEIKLTEPKEVLIHHIYRVSEKELAKECLSRYSGSKLLFWSNGVAFLFELVPPVVSGELADDYIKGREHWQEVYYSEMPKYKEFIELEDGDFRGAKVRIIDASGFSPHKEFAKWVSGKR